MALLAARLRATSCPPVPVPSKVLLDVGRVDPPLTFDFVGRNSLFAQHLADRALADRQVVGERLRREKRPEVLLANPDRAHTPAPAPVHLSSARAASQIGPARAIARSSRRADRGR